MPVAENAGQQEDAALLLEGGALRGIEYSSAFMPQGHAVGALEAVSQAGLAGSTHRAKITFAL